MVYAIVFHHEERVASKFVKIKEENHAYGWDASYPASIQARTHAIMISYNLVNGVHTSESAELLESILRDEWGFEGLVMTDWVVHGMTRTDMKNPRATASATIKAGNELFMPGCEEDRQDILAALRGESGAAVRLSRSELEKQAARVVRMARALAGQ